MTMKSVEIAHHSRPILYRSLLTLFLSWIILTCAAEIQNGNVSSSTKVVDSACKFRSKAPLQRNKSVALT